MNHSLSIETLKRHIEHDLLNNPELDLQPDEDLLLSGLLDSLNVVKLVSFVEQECKLSIAPEDVLVEHFGSLRQIMDYVQSRSDA